MPAGTLVWEHFLARRLLDKGCLSIFQVDSLSLSLREILVRGLQWTPDEKGIDSAKYSGHSFCIGT